MTSLLPMGDRTVGLAGFEPASFLFPIVSWVPGRTIIDRVHMSITADIEALPY